VRYISDHLRAQARECFRLAKEARDKSIAKALDDLGHKLHEFTDQFEDGNDARQ
jgi:hypothetical protein